MVNRQSVEIVHNHTKHSRGDRIQLLYTVASTICCIIFSGRPGSTDQGRTLNCQTPSLQRSLQRRKARRFTPSQVLRRYVRMYCVFSILLYLQMKILDNYRKLFRINLRMSLCSFCLFSLQSYRVSSRFKMGDKQRED